MTVPNLKDNTGAWWVYIEKTKELIHITENYEQANFAAEWACALYEGKVWVLGQKMLYETVLSEKDASEAL